MPKIEVVKQRDLTDCGPCALLCIIKYYNGYVPIEKIREDTCVNAQGTSAYHLIKAALNYGFDAQGVKVENIFDENIFLPAIAHVCLKNGLQHFVVVTKITKNNIFLMDPAQGKVKMPLDEFRKIWSKVLILLTPKTEILKLDKDTNLFTLFLNLLKENKKTFSYICIINVLLMFSIIISNFYFQTTIASINEGNDVNFLKFIVLLFFFIIILKIFMTYLKSYYLTHFNKNIDTDMYTNFIDHIFNLPLKFMQNRTTGEIISRVEDLSQIKSLISEVFTNLILNSILILGAILALYFINTKLFFLLCLIICIYIFIGLIFSHLIYQEIKNNIDVTTEFNTTLVETIEMNSSLKNLNLTNSFLKRIENKLILMLKANFNLENLINIIEFFKNFVYEIGLFSINTLGIILIYQGKLAILSLVTFNSLILYLFDPVKDIVNLIPKYNYLKAIFAKLNDFLSINEEVYNKGLECLDCKNIKVSNLTYSYNNYSNVLNNLSFNIAPGEKIFLKGASGSGKSTICKLLYRTLNNYSGEIKYLDTSEKDYSLNAIRNNILYVGQEENLFTASIKDNIMCFRNLDETDFKEVLKICQIDKIIKDKPNRLETIINASVNNLSGGEKQRIILARALLKNANILILDEALSEVNFEMEKTIIKNILKRYHDKTLIYVSHKNVASLFNKVIEVK